MNIIQALKNSAAIVRDKNAPKEKRAVHLCWILHLAGDSHQPLHSAALYTTHRFRSGDHGGNYLEYEHGWNLHGFWDEQISTDEPFETLRMLATDLDQNPKLKADGKKAAATLDPDKWIDESFVARQAIRLHEGSAQESRRPRRAFALGPARPAGEVQDRSRRGRRTPGRRGRLPLGERRSSRCCK